MEFKTEEIAALIGGEIEGDGSVSVSFPSKIEEGSKGALCFLANEKYEHYLYTTKASAVIVAKTLQLQKPISPTLIRVEDPYSAFSTLLEHFQFLLEGQDEEEEEVPKFISKSAEVAQSAKVGAYAVISKRAIIGENVVIYPQVFIDSDVVIGDNSILYSGVKIYKGCKIGERNIIHAGTVIGADGFGFAPQEDGSYKKVPQLGNVETGSEVEIGANTSIDRATMGSTVIESGVKLDNLVQIAHNVKIGSNTVVASQAGISGSTEIGSNCMIGGQAGFVGHIKIANGTKVNAQSGVAKAVKEEGTAISGSPAVELRQFYKSMATLYGLPDKMKAINALIKDKE